MRPKASIAHQTPRRVRLQLREHRGDAALFARIEDALRATRQFRDVRTNARTGSVTLDLDAPLADSLGRAGSALPFDIEMPERRAAPARVDGIALDPLRLVSGRALNPMFMAGTLFVAVGVVQAARGRLLVPALSAFWYATSAFRLSRHAGPPGGGRE
jgi:hypothetical protein